MTYNTRAPIEKKSRVERGIGEREGEGARAFKAGGVTHESNIVAWSRGGKNQPESSTSSRCILRVPTVCGRRSPSFFEQSDQSLCVLV